jgi:D-alanyl-D-alanine carboxypeptidase
MSGRPHRRFGRTAVAAALLAGALVTAAPLAPASTSVGATAVPAQPSLQQLAKRIVDVGVPGAVVLVRDEHGVRAGVAGWGNLRSKERFGPDHRFRIGSLTKSFVATVVLELVAEDLLALDDSIEQWLPGLVPNGSAITLRQLLNHTSGLYNYTDDPDWLAQIARNRLEVWTPQALVAVATSHRTTFGPGSRWSYSNTGYIVLGLVVEKATGMTLADELRMRIIEPLGLSGTTFPTAPTLEAPYAHGYALPGNILVPTPSRRPVDVTVLSPSWAWAAGAVVSTARDIARFYSALLRGELLRAEELAEIRTTVAIASTAAEYGLGLLRLPLRCGMAWGHDGSVPGYLAVAYSSADGSRQAVILANASLATTRQRIRVEEALLSSFCR